MRFVRSQDQAGPESIADASYADIEADYIALQELCVGAGPVGGSRICAALAAVGISTSEATAGRLLRSLDRRGYSQPFGSKGRVLTDKGRQHLEALEDARRHRYYHQSLLDATSVDSIEDILDMLGARRAVEAETARLAALRASDEEVEAIERAAVVHMHTLAAGEDGVDENCAFHVLIARVSKSRVLFAVVEMLLQNTQLQVAQDRIQTAVGSVLPEEHKPLLQAIKDHQPDRAAEAMRVHIDGVIKSVHDCEALAEEQLDGRHNSGRGLPVSNEAVRASPGNATS